MTIKQRYKRRKCTQFERNDYDLQMQADRTFIKNEQYMHADVSA